MMSVVENPSAAQQNVFSAMAASSSSSCCRISSSSSGLICFLLLLLAFASLQIHPSTRLSRSSFLSIFQGKGQDDANFLRKLLEKTAMPDRTVIFTSVNAAWAEPGSLLDLFLESFRMLNSTENLLNHLIIVTFDQKAYKRCVELHPYCYQLKTEGVDFMGAKAYMSGDYVKMMWRRIQFLNIVLEEGYSFIFSDADILWFRNPIPHLLPDKDFQISCDRFNGIANSSKNSPNGGYSFARSNERTIEFYKFWYESHKAYPTKHDQDVFIEIREQEQMEEIGVKIGYLDTKHFVSFCSHWTFDMHVGDTIHANCCNGLANKVRNLRTILTDWEAFRTNVTKEDHMWKGPDGCSWEWI